MVNGNRKRLWQRLPLFKNDLHVVAFPVGAPDVAELCLQPVQQLVVVVQRQSVRPSDLML